MNLQKNAKWKLLRYIYTINFEYLNILYKLIFNIS